jgi:hypothetical protein
LVVGAAAGAWAGLGYLSDDGRCTGIIESTAACQLKHGWIPFIGMVVLGMLVALAIAAIVRRVDAGLDSRTPGRSLAGIIRREPQGLEEEMREVPLNSGELGLERSGEHEDVRGRGSGQAEPVRIGQRGRPVPKPR